MTRAADTGCARNILARRAADPRSTPATVSESAATRRGVSGASTPCGRLASHVVAAFCLGTLALGACTAITPETVKSRESSGATRHYDRTSTDVYSASIAAVPIMRADSNYWNQLEIVERDPASGTVVLEQNLDSAVLPGVGTRDAIGIFVKPVPPDASDVTVVVMSSDQLPGSAATSVSSWPTASSLVFPAIDQALEAIPEQPRTAAAAPPPAAVPPAARPTAAPPVTSPRVTTPPAAVSPSAPQPAVPTVRSQTASPTSPVLDRVYDTLRASGAWRPLVRETRADGSEEIRVGSWATLSDVGDGSVRLKVKEGSAHAADAARLALELSQGGFAVVVEAEAAPRHQR
jgi:hypothetical protein